MALRGDYKGGYRAYRRILAAGETRGYEPDTSRARGVFSMFSCWFEPLENGVQQAQRAREGLIAGGDLAFAPYMYHPTVFYLLDCAPALDGFVAEVEAGLAFVRRTGHERVGQWLDCFRWLAGVLRGERPAAAEAVPAGRAGNLLALFNAHFTRAVAAAIFGDPAGTAGGDQRGGLLAELDEQAGWLAARAADAPDNFLHLLRLLEAERAWAVGDFRAAAHAFDGARREVGERQRPWHRALIEERAARFYLAYGLERAGYELLARAREGYLEWGASAKVAQLDWAYPTARAPPPTRWMSPRSFSPASVPIAISP